jgi:hypothetical protein
VPLYLPPSRAKPPPLPARTDDLRAAAGGHGLGACVAGIVLGLLFLAYLHRRDRRARERS